MKKTEKTTIDKKRATGLFTLVMLCLCFLPLMINSAALDPYATVLSSNVVSADSMLLYVIDYLMALFEIVALAASFSIIIISVFLGSKKITAITALIFIASFILQIPVSILMNVPLYGTVGTLKDVVLSCIPMLTYVLFCSLHLLIVYFIALSLRRKYMMPASLRRRTGAREGYDPELLPLKSIYSKQNPLQVSALYACVLIVALKLIMHIAGDIYYGFPEEIGGIIAFAVSYIVDLAYGFVAYVIVLLIFSLTSDKLVIKNTDGAISPSDEGNLLD
jgi:hypothetical protein